MAFGAEDVQPAGLDHFLVLAVGVGFVAREDLVPLIGRDRVLIAGVVPNRAVGIVDVGFDLALRGADRLRDSLLHALLLGHEFGIAAEQNVGAAAGHVGGDGDHALASGLRDNFRFALVVLRVQNDVFFSPFFLSSSESRSDFSIEVVPTSTGWPLSCSLCISSAAAKYFSFSVR